MIPAPDPGWWHERRAKMEKCSVYEDSQREIDRFKWIESEKVGYDLGEVALHRWVREHWNGYLRARWLEHLEGKTFWLELDRGDFGLFQRQVQDQPILLECILDRLKAAPENLNIINSALDWGLHTSAGRHIP